MCVSVHGLAEAHELRRTLKAKAMSTALGIAGMVWITAAVAFTLVEDVGTGRRVDSYGDALWWSATTISTVGYGDVYPVTPVVRKVAVFTMIVGVSTFGVLTASIARLLIKKDHIPGTDRVIAGSQTIKNRWTRRHVLLATTA